MIYIILAILSGVSVVLARVINYMLAERIGILQGTFFNYLFGFLGSLILLGVSGGMAKAFSIETLSAPWWAYTGGLIGIIVVTLSSFLSAKISAFYLSILLFVGQLFAGIFIDYIVSGTFSIFKIVGGIVVVAGLSYNLIIDKKSV